MKTTNSEAISNEYLHINSCGCQHFFDRDTGCLRPDGRIDYHLLYIAEGCCHITDNEKTEIAPAGSVVVYLPKERQEYKFYSGTRSTSYYIHFSGTACHELLKKFELENKRIFYVGKSTQLENEFNQLIDEFHLKLPLNEYLCQSYLLIILSLISRKMTNSQTGVEMRSKKLIEQTCRYMYANYSKNIAVCEYAKMCNLSESRFSHLFKEHMHISPIQYLLNIKIEKAKELLENTDMSILEISRILGMQSQNYFSRIFKKYVGHSPMVYRKLHSG